MENETNIKDLINDVKEYVKLKYDFAKLDFVEKLSLIVSSLFLLVISSLLILAGIVYLSASLAIYLSGILGSTVLAFAIVGVLFLILFLIIYLLRFKLIINPVVRYFIKLLFGKTKEDNNG